MRLPELRLDHHDRGRERARRDAVRRCLRPRRRGRAPAARPARERIAVRRSDQHPVHQRHHRVSQGRHPDPPQHPEQRLLCRRGDAARPGRPAVHPGAALSLLRHGAGQSRLPDPRRRDGVSRARGSTRSPLSRRSSRRALHRTARRSDDVHRRDGPPRFRQVRFVVAAHRDHGRQPVPDRGHEARDRAHAPRSDHDRLRHDRDQPGQLPVLDRRPDRAPGLDRRPGAPACRGQDRRRRMPSGTARHTRRIVDPRLSGHARLLGRRGEDMRGDRPGALDEDRRSRDDRRRRAIATSSVGSRTW